MWLGCSYDLEAVVSRKTWKLKNKITWENEENQKHGGGKKSPEKEVR